MLSAVAVEFGVVGEGEFDGEVVKDVSVSGVGAGLSSAEGDGFDRELVFSPEADVDVVDVLFDDVVTGEPGEVEPVFELPFHV